MGCDSRSAVSAPPISTAIRTDSESVGQHQKPETAALLVWAVCAAASAIVIGLIVAAPLAQAHNHLDFASAIYRAFSYVCHQIPERSFHFAGHKFGVCSRCTGLYSGFALAVLVYPLTRSLKRTDTPRIVWLILAAAPLAIDFSLTYFGIWSNTHLSRSSSGALLGATAVFYIVPGLIELSTSASRIFTRQR